MKSRIVLFAFCVALLSSCGNKGNDTGKVPEFAVQEVQKSTASLISSHPATIEGKQDVEIRPQVSGFITKLCVDEGATVRKGQVLFIIDPVQYEAAVRTAKAAIKTAEAAVKTQQITVDNKRDLNKKQIISDYDLSMAENTLAQAQAQLAQAQAQLTTAQQNLSFTQVKSPTEGIINKIPFRLGALVSPSTATPMTTVSELGEVNVYFNMTEKELLTMAKSGNIKEELNKLPAVKLQLIDGSMFNAEGKIEIVTGVIENGSVLMRAKFPNDNHILHSGGSANIQIPYNMENAINIPQSATIEIQDKKFVYILQPDNTVKYTEITIFNLDNGKDYLVTSGLNSGDKIVIEGVQTLKDGMKIQPITQAQKEANYQQALKDQHDGNIATAFN
ncbi:efflux RND transporter periplasmic adaptor subunit [Bacteroides sp.]|uniref:efflux RND transporter periplasmic adaptor subunit n=1 Tax=Bacteroides sp. TaxID=29523 RepID=UPI002624EA10|nr:efflux RND transporter periplasmic adaptor subunit [Bacteroides sp.]MDD3036376.1 efflux RND transporter periplasmic adaptor subunit [Bacteroides sp.]